MSTCLALRLYYEVRTVNLHQANERHYMFLAQALSTVDLCPSEEIWIKEKRRKRGLDSAYPCNHYSVMEMLEERYSKRIAPIVHHNTAYQSTSEVLPLRLKLTHLGLMSALILVVFCLYFDYSTIQ